MSAAVLPAFMYHIIIFLAVKGDLSHFTIILYIGRNAISSQKISTLYFYIVSIEFYFEGHTYIEDLRIVDLTLPIACLVTVAC